MEDVRGKQQSPYFITSSPRQAFLTVGKSVVCECKVDVALLLISAFFVLIYVIPLGVVISSYFSSVFY